MPHSLYTVISDDQLNEEFVSSITNRKIEQKFFYLGAGAKKFYIDSYDTETIQEIYKKKHIETLDYGGMLLNHLDKSQKRQIVSLGCGDAVKDKQIIEQLLKAGYQCSYIGIDSSIEMTTLAQKTMTSIEGVASSYICADITQQKFFSVIEKYRLPDSNFIFLFLGSTFGNISQFHLTDAFYNLMNKGDKLLFDCQTWHTDQKKQGWQFLTDFLIISKIQKLLIGYIPD